MADELITTTYHVLRPTGPEAAGFVTWPREPGLEAIRSLVEPFVEGDLEHVSVLYKDKRADMFVSENGLLLGLPRNEAATTIYRANWLKRFPKANPEKISFIVGVAVIFDRIVWY